MNTKRITRWYRRLLNVLRIAGKAGKVLDALDELDTSVEREKGLLQELRQYERTGPGTSLYEREQRQRVQALQDARHRMRQRIGF